jgi:hypothetical protein
MNSISGSMFAATIGFIADAADTVRIDDADEPANQQHPG